MSYPDVVARVEASARRAGRSPEEVTLVAVSKDKGPEEMMEIYRQGQLDFGENRAQELVAKAAVLPEDIRWHFVGSLQSNKARLVRPLTHLLHSMDRESLASSWLKGSGPAPPALVQVNVGEEPQKSGVGPGQAAEAIAVMEGMGVSLRGLMAIPPIPGEPEESRPYFRRLRLVRDSVMAHHPAVVELSMGMTDDFEVAIEEGASIIRVGRAIFGPRN